MPPYRRNVNTVFQDYALFPHLNVLDNVAYGLMVKGVGKAERAQGRRGGADTGEAARLRRAPPGQLSGGQRQRVALARALVNQPKVLLLDEPLGALDLKLRETDAGRAEDRCRSALGITFVFVTHDQGEALSMADRVAVFNDGRIVQIGTPQDIYQRPKTRFVADFVGSSNVLPPDFVSRYSAASAAGRACGRRRSASAGAERRRRRPSRATQLPRRHHPPGRRGRWRCVCTSPCRPATALPARRRGRHARLGSRRTCI